MKTLLFPILLGLATMARADEVRLQVNGSDGKPIAGALVRVQESSGDWFDPKFEAPLDLVSDEKGVLKWESKGSLATDEDKEMRRKGRAMARVSAPGFAFGSIGLKAGDNVVTLGAPVTLEGTIKDENQQPIQGARLSVESFFLLAGGEDARYISFGKGLEIEVRSDAQGRWRLEGLPIGKMAAIEVEAPGFRRLEFRIPTSQSAPPIFLRPGATIKGRILRPDGTGAPDVQFFAGDFQNQPRTDAQGRFEVGGLAPGSVYLQIAGGDSAEKLPFVLSSNPVFGLSAGEVRDIGDWKADKGVRVKGRIVDRMKMPIIDARVQIWDRGIAQGETDKTGAFDFVATAGASRASISAPGYVSERSSALPVAKEGVVDMGVISLASGQKLSGILKNQAGAPLADTYLTAERNGDVADNAQTDEKGEFTFDGLETGKYKLQLPGKKIVSGAEFTVGATNDKPLVVVIAGKDAPGKLAITPLETRVVDENGAPVAGAQVALKLVLANEGFRDFVAISDAEGALNQSLSDVGEKLEVKEVFRPGYAAGLHDVKLENGVWRGEVRLQTRGLALRGHVVNAAGQPLAGIAVGLASGVSLPVTTGADGAFALPDAPQSGATILASDGARLASFADLKVGQKIEIALPAAVSTDKNALVAAITPRARWQWNLLLDSWDDFGAARIESIMMALPVKASSALVWSQFLQMLARRDPAYFVAHESELRAHRADGNREEFEDNARLARAAAGSAAQKAAVQTWLDSERKVKRELTEESASALLVRAEIAARLGNAQQTQTWLDYAAQISDYVASKGNQSWEWGNALALIGPDAALKFSENWKPVAQMQILQSALRASAKLGDADAVEANWQRIQKLAVEAETEPLDNATRVEGFVQKPGEIRKWALGEYAQFLSRTNPKAAYALAAELDANDLEFAQTMPIIGENAAKLGEFEVARLALAATFKTNFSNTNFGAHAAQIAATFDEKFAGELFELTYAKSLPNPEGRSSDWSLANYAAARAPRHPGETRLLVEREWPTRLEDALKPRDENDRNYDSGDEQTLTLLGALAPAAPARAVELAERLPERKQLRAKAFATILGALLEKQSD